jgi:hypothetical protein
MSGQPPDVTPEQDALDAAREQRRAANRVVCRTWPSHTKSEPDGHAGHTPGTRAYSKAGHITMRKTLAKGGPEARALTQPFAQWEAQLRADLGGHVSAIQETIIEMCTRSRAILNALDEYILSVNAFADKRTRRAFPIVMDRMKVSDTLARHLALLTNPDLARRPQKLPTLDSYVSTHYSGANGTHVEPHEHEPHEDADAHERDEREGESGEHASDEPPIDEHDVDTRDEPQHEPREIMTEDALIAPARPRVPRTPV